MRSTEKQIELAERLQKAGICQDAERWIVLDGNNEIIFSTRNKMPKTGLIKVGGPLPTFEEVWAEIQKILPFNWSLTLCKDNYILFRNKLEENIEGFNGDRITEAATEALLYLHGEKQ